MIVKQEGIFGIYRGLFPVVSVMSTYLYTVKLDTSIIR